MAANFQGDWGKAIYAVRRRPQGMGRHHYQRRKFVYSLLIGCLVLPSCLVIQEAIWLVAAEHDRIRLPTIIELANRDAEEPITFQPQIPTFSVAPETFIESRSSE